MNRLRIALDFVTAETPPRAIAELRAYLAGMMRDQEMGTKVGPRDLERSGFAGVRLMAAELEEEARG